MIRIRTTETRTFEDLPLRRHLITAKLQQTSQVTEVFDLPEHGEILLQLPFVAAGLTLCDLRKTAEKRLAGEPSSASFFVFVFWQNCTL